MSENRQKRTIAPRTSRPKPAAPGTEEAGAVLQLGEFQDVDTLTLSEASLVINALVAKRRADRRNVNETEYVLLHSFFTDSLYGDYARREADKGVGCCSRR